MLTLAGYIALLVRFSGWVVLGLLAATVPAFIAETRFSGAAFRLRNWRSPDTRRLHYLEYVLANDEHAKEVKLFGLGPLLLGRYRSLAETVLRRGPPAWPCGARGGATCCRCSARPRSTAATPSSWPPPCAAG